ncbi:hypothetical protein C8R43DRAFT_478749 [Mycena crocata]|nr:hypothetical protein C8R43DRAFT_478749 [Mycena crocata]
MRFCSRPRATYCFSGTNRRTRANSPLYARSFASRKAAAERWHIESYTMCSRSRKQQENPPDRRRPSTRPAIRVTSATNANPPSSTFQNHLDSRLVKISRSRLRYLPFPSKSRTPATYLTRSSASRKPPSSSFYFPQHGIGIPATPPPANPQLSNLNAHAPRCTVYGVAMYWLLAVGALERTSAPAGLRSTRPAKLAGLGAFDSVRSTRSSRSGCRGRIRRTSPD